MTTKTTTTLLIGSGLALALALAIWSPVQAQSADPAERMAMTETQMMQRCKEMKEQKLKMMEGCKAQDAQLTEQLAAMNSAPDDEKVGQIAAVVTLLAEQRIARDARRSKMHEEMMTHMMQHMQMGKDSMPKCPMMKGMDGKAPDAEK